MVEDLLRGFVREQWVEQLDFSTLEKMNGSYISDDLRGREDDIIWRVRRGADWLYVYLLLEFQSSVDQWMAVRIMTYVGLLYQDLVRSDQVGNTTRLPPVLPVVLYNGDSAWTAATDIAYLVQKPLTGCPTIRFFDPGGVSALRCRSFVQACLAAIAPLCGQARPCKDAVPVSAYLVQEVPGGLDRYRPHLRYLLLAERDYRDDHLESLNNLVAALFRLENSRNPEQLLQVVTSLLQWLAGPGQDSLRRAFTVWFGRVLFPAHFAENNQPARIFHKGRREMRESAGDAAFRAENCLQAYWRYVENNFQEKRRRFSTFTHCSKPLVKYPG